MNKPVEHVVIPENEAEIYSEEEGRFILNSVSNFYCINALGERIFFKTKNRALAQEACDELYGKGRYGIRSIRDTKGKSRQENGEVSVRGSNTRKCFSPRLKGLK